MLFILTLDQGLYKSATNFTPWKQNKKIYEESITSNFKDLSETKTGLLFKTSEYPNGCSEAYLQLFNAHQADSEWN